MAETIEITCCVFVLQIAEAAKTPSQADDLYLDDAGSGGYYPEDDDDFNSGSGSGEAHTHTHIWTLAHTHTRKLGMQSARGVMRNSVS